MSFRLKGFRASGYTGVYIVEFFCWGLWEDTRSLFYPFLLLLQENGAGRCSTLGTASYLQERTMPGI